MYTIKFSYVSNYNFAFSSFLGTNMLLLSPNNKVDFGFSSTSTQSLVTNSTLKESQISTNSILRTHPIIQSFSNDTHVTPVEKCNG